MTTPSPNVHQLPPRMIEVEQVIDPDQVAEEQARKMQGMSEGVVMDARVECMGGQYRISDRVGLMPLMRFAHSASQGVDSDDLEGLVAIYDMLRDCIAAEDWSRFERDMTAKKAEADDMMPVVQKTIEILSARPTRQRSDSSSGPQSISPISTDGSFSRVPAGAEELVPVGQLASSG